MNFETRIDVSASAENAWQVIGEQFGDIGKWSASLESSFLKGVLGVGAIRTCKGKGFGPFPPSTIEEKLTHFDSKKFQFTYEANKGLPAFVKKAQNAWSIEAIDSDNCIIYTRALVTLSPWMKPFGWILPMILKRDMGLFTEELIYRVEQGQPHPRKTTTY
jgi:hypothetical protein